MKLLYATSNASKLHSMRTILKELPIEVMSPKDLDIKINIVEDGTTPIENALKKAKAYYDATGIPTLGADSGLYIEKLPEEKQPGLFIRRVNGIELTDEQVIEHYTNLITNVGGESLAWYMDGIALITVEGTFTTEIKEDSFILTDKIYSGEIKKGFPLDSISIEPSSNKYYVELKDEELIKGSVIDNELVGFLGKNFINNQYKR